MTSEPKIVVTQRRRRQRKLRVEVPKKQQNVAMQPRAPRRRARNRGIRAAINGMRSLQINPRALNFDTLSSNAVDWASMVVNPFGTGEEGGVARLARVPDNDAEDTYLLHASGQLTIPANTFTSAWITAQGHSLSAEFGTTTEPDLIITYGADVTSTNAMTTTYLSGVKVSEYTTMGTMAPQYCKMRMISAGLRVNCDALDTAAGFLDAFQPESLAKSAAAAYATNATLGVQKIGDGQNVKDGITVRRELCQEYFDFVRPPYPYYGTAGVGVGVGKSPFGSPLCVRVTGLSATTVLRVEWNYVYEVIPADACPLQTSSSEWEPQFDSLRYWVNKQPIVAKGHSFKTFLDGIGRGAKFIWRNRAKIAPTIRDVVGVAKDVVGAATSW